MFDKSMSEVNDSTFSSLLFINECLLDEDRTTLLRTAIREQVKKGDVVLDAGTGSGILAMFAAEAGASKVYAVDVDPEAISLARRSTQASRYADKIEVVQADLKEFTTAKPVDVVIMEMLDTGLITEQQGPALNALRRHKVIGPQTRLIPEGVVCCVEGVEYDFTFYGFTMPVTLQARNDGVQKRVKSVLTEPTPYQTVEFGGRIATLVDEDVILTIEHAGTLNALRLRTQTLVSGHLTIWETSDMNMPVIIPIEPMEVVRGQEIKVSIRYLMGAGYNSLGVTVTSPAPSSPWFRTENLETLLQSS